MSSVAKELFLRITNPKFDLIEVESDNEKLYRIRALRDFADVRAGDIGGFVHGHHNLSHSGSSWLYDDSAALDRSHVGQDAKLFGTSKLENLSQALGEAELQGNVRMIDNSQALERARLVGNVEMSGMSIVSESAVIVGDISISDTVHVTGDATVHSPENQLSIDNSVVIRDQANVIGGAQLNRISGNHIIEGDDWVTSRDELENRSLRQTTSALATSASLGGSATNAGATATGGNANAWGHGAELSLREFSASATGSVTETESTNENYYLPTGSMVYASATTSANATGGNESGGSAGSSRLNSPASRP